MGGLGVRVGCCPLKGTADSELTHHTHAFETGLF